MTEATPSGRLIVFGSEVRLDGEHLCVARDEEAALAIRDALDFAGVATTSIPPKPLKNIIDLLL